MDNFIQLIIIISIVVFMEKLCSFLPGQEFNFKRAVVLGVVLWVFNLFFP